MYNAGLPKNGRGRCSKGIRRVKKCRASARYEKQWYARRDSLIRALERLHPVCVDTGSDNENSEQGTFTLEQKITVWTKDMCMRELDSMQGAFKNIVDSIRVSDSKGFSMIHVTQDSLPRDSVRLVN